MFINLNPSSEKSEFKMISFFFCEGFRPQKYWQNIEVF